ncbi:hypothetical protein DRO55_02220 [Candidatus Bathyarchaeota archaeon]|nr:MAG: hypothetical protein DRO55_02220 [Candidatus Bathyarchaeota archaeon]
MRARLFGMKLPVAIFVLILAALLGVSCILVEYISMKYSKGNYFRLETRFVDLEFPRNWIAVTGKKENSSGVIISVACVSSGQDAGVFFIVYDENMTRIYLEKVRNWASLRGYRVNDTSAAILFEAERLFNYHKNRTKVNDGNVTLLLLDNGMIKVSNYEANYLTIMIMGLRIERGGGSEICNGTWRFISWIYDKKLSFVVLYGIGEYWNQPEIWEIFNHILNSTRYK